MTRDELAEGLMPGSPQVLLAEQLVLLRRRIAPPGSWRERSLRAIYVPLLNRLARRRLQQNEGSVDSEPRPQVDYWTGTAARAVEMGPINRILILKLDHLGDFVLALPAFVQLREAFPCSFITVVCGSWNRAWAEQCGLFDDVRTFDFFTPTNGEWSGPGPAKFAAFEELCLDAFDLAIDLRHDFDTRPLLTRVDARFRAGFCAPHGAGGDLLDIALPDMEHISTAQGTGRPVHAELRLLILAAAVVATFRPARHAANRLVRPVDGRHLPERPYAILAPGAGSPIRLWPTDRLIAVGQALQREHDLDIVLTGGRNESSTAMQIAAALPTSRVRNLADRLPLNDLPGVIRGASIYVGLDTGTTHLAAALGVPTVAITSGVPSLEVWHASGPSVCVVVGKIACSPCYLVHAAQCPYDVACLHAITADDVVAACESLLQRQTALVRIAPAA